MGKIRQIILTSTSCGTGADKTACAELQQSFASSITYVQIRDEAGYASLGALLNNSSALPGYLGRLAYFSVDTSLVPSMLRQLRVHGGVGLGMGTVNGESDASHPFSRVIVEKPLGNDAQSCGALVRALQREMGGMRGELLVMDHYLGKTGLKMAVEFRKRMSAVPAWSRLFTSNSGHMEVVVLEDETADGRTGFYNGVGIMRDMVQSHISLFLAAAGGPSRKPWGIDHRMAAFNAIFADAAMHSHAWYHSDAVVGGVSTTVNTTRSMQPMPASSRFVPRNASQAVAHAVRFGRYTGYSDHVKSDRAPGGSGSFTYNVSHARGCLQEAAIAQAQEIPVRSECESIPSFANAAPYDLYGSGYRALTGVDVSVEMGKKVLDMRVAKAVGVRTGYFRHSVRADEGAGGGCGPLTLTFHMQGRVVLPPGVNHSDPDLTDDKLPHGMPAVLLTGICPSGLGRSLHALMHTEHGWPSEWSSHFARNAGVGWITPRLEPWISRYIASRSGDVTALVEEEQGLLARAALTARLSKLASTPGLAGQAAYTGMIAAALAGETGGFSSPEEATRLWEVWAGLITASDAAAAGPLLAHALAVEPVEGRAALSAQAVLDPSQDPSAAPPMHATQAAAYLARLGLPAQPMVREYTVGDSSWMRALRRPSVSTVSAWDQHVRPGSGGSTGLESTQGPYLLVRGGDTSGSGVDKFATDLLTCAWFAHAQTSALAAENLDGHSGSGASGREPHIAFDALQHIVLDTVYERLSEPDCLVLGPWRSMHVWPVMESRAGAEHALLTTRLGLPLELEMTNIHAHATPSRDVKGMNALAHALIHNGALDAVVLLFSLNRTATAAVQTRKSTPGDGPKGQGQPVYEFVDAASKEGMRLTRAAVQGARQVFVIVPRAVLSEYPSANGQGVTVSADGSIGLGGGTDNCASVCTLYADPVAGEAKWVLPEALARDIQEQAGGREHVIRVYII